ncbi:MAG TPA: NUDIX hydrolase [Sphingomonas sp.]
MSETMWAGRFLEVRKQGSWEYAARRGGVSAAVIVAVEDGHLLLVEQMRIPIGRRCLELPAGLVGDDVAGEAVEIAAARELEEECGYRPARIEVLGEFQSSPGMTSEDFTLVRASGLTRVSKGGGVEGEGIEVHRVALDELAAFVAAKRAAGVAIDSKLLAVLGPVLLGGL